MTSPIPALSFRPHPFNNHENPVLLQGKYEISHDTSIIALLAKIHTDAKVFGEDAHEFKLERMLQENFDKLPKNAWKVSFGFP